MNLIFRMWLYDLLYSVGDSTIKEYKPCGIKLGTEGTVQCLINQLHKCCGGCEYLGENGCTIKSLGCKLTLCLDLKDRYARARKANEMLETTKELAMRYNICTIRSPKHKTMQRLRRWANFEGGM